MIVMPFGFDIPQLIVLACFTLLGITVGFLIGVVVMGRKGERSSKYDHNETGESRR